MRALVVIALGCAVLAGCESFHGLSRTAALNAVPALSCIESVLAQTPGVERVDVRTYIGAYRRPTTRFSYLYTGADNTVQVSEIVVEQVGDSAHFRNTMISLADNISGPRLESGRATMIQVEQRLVHQCGLQELQTVIEQCKGSSCDG